MAIVDWVNRIRLRDLTVAAVCPAVASQLLFFGTPTELRSAPILRYELSAALRAAGGMVVRSDRRRGVMKLRQDPQQQHVARQFASTELNDAAMRLVIAILRIIAQSVRHSRSRL
jgi:hypothetical protein